MEILILFVLFLLNGFFALSEISLVSARKPNLERRAAEGSSGAARALELKKDPDKFLSAIQVGITLIGIVTGVYGGARIADDVTPIIESLAVLQNYAAEIAMVLTIVLITYVSIVIGELVPKTIGMGQPEKIAVKVAPVISVFSKVFFPFVKLLSFSTNLITSILRIKPEKETISKGELRYMLKMAASSGIIPMDQQAFHQQAFYFADKKARHLMTHRSDVDWISIRQPVEQIRKEILEMRHSKIICVGDDKDEVVGVLNVRDFYQALAHKEQFDPEDLLSDPLMMPEHVPARTVLQMMKEKSTHLCIVVNEYGSWEGIITLHDIFEDLVGELPDEWEKADPDFHKREDGSFLVNGDAPVEMLARIMDHFPIDFGKIDYATVGGFVYNQLSRFPDVGDSFTYLGYKFEVMDLDGKRIDKVLVTRVEVADKDE